MVYRYVRKMDKQTLKYRRKECMSFLNSVVLSKTRGDLIAEADDDVDDDDKDDGEDGNCSPTHREMERENGVTVSFNLPGSTSAVLRTAEMESSDDGGEKIRTTISTHSTAVSELVGEGSRCDDDRRDTLPSDQLDESGGHSGPSSERIGPRSCDDSEEGEDADDLPPSALKRISSMSNASPRRRSTLGNGVNVRRLVSDWKSSRSQYREDYQRTMEVFHQACFYLGVFYLTHIWSTTNRIVQLVNNGSSFYGVTVMHAM